MRCGSVRRPAIDYALFLHAEDQVASGGRIALGVIGLAGCFIGFCAPNVGGQQQLDYASLVDLKTGEVVWFNVVQAGSQIPGIKFGDLRTPEGAAQMVERLLGRMKPGRAVREQRARDRADVPPLRRAHPPLAARRRRRRRGGAAHRRRAGARPPAGHGPADRARVQRPTERDEIGLWQQMERVEEEIAGSNLLINDPKLTGYLKNLIGTVGGPAAKDFRIYLARIPDFNAMMFPSGFAVVFSGLLLRMRNEAQLAGVIAHESGHFLRRHMIRSWRDQKRKSDVFAIGAMLAGVGGAGAGVYLGDYVQLAQLGTILSLFQYSRAMEAEADAMGARLIADTGYPPIEMANIWQQLIGEADATARYRGKRRRRGSLFDTHPST